MNARGIWNRGRVARLGVGGLAAAGVLSLVLVGGAAAQDIAAAGNGGTAEASADGGVVEIGDVNSGGNTGSDIAVGDVGTADEKVCDKYGKCTTVSGSDAAVAIDGGDVSTDTSLDVSADGGTAIADASGGDENDAVLLTVQ